jgi:hypothetical protein
MCNHAKNSISVYVYSSVSNLSIARWNGNGIPTCLASIPTGNNRIPAMMVSWYSANRAVDRNRANMTVLL